MPDRSFTAEQVVSLIETAFPDDAFTGNVIYEGGENYEDSAMTAVHFGGRSWKGFEPAFLRKYGDAIYFFTSEAYVFFLPAFLVAIVEAFDEVDALVETVVGTLVPDRSEEEAVLFAERGRLLNHDQKRAIAAFLCHIKEEHGGADLNPAQQESLDAHWETFL